MHLSISEKMQLIGLVRSNWRNCWRKLIDDMYDSLYAQLPSSIIYYYIKQQEVQLQWTSGIQKSESRISLLDNYCITINIKIISSINIFILKVQVLGSHELKSHCHIWQGTLKNDWINFQHSCICTSMQKIRLLHLFSFEI